MDPFVMLGVVLCLFGSIGNNLGNNIQSLGLQRKAAKESERAGSSGGISKTWIFGTVIFLSGALLIFTSFAFAPASLLAPIESIQFVSNVMFGKFVLGRTVTRKMLVGTCLIVAGTLLAVTSGSHESQKLTVDDLIRYWVSPVWLAFVACIVTTAVVAWLVHQFFNLRMRQGKALHGHQWISPLTYALFSAIAGTQSVVQAKCMSELVEQWTSGNGNIWLSWFTYGCVLFWVAMAVVWLYQLNKALGIYDPLFMIPLLQANFILFAVLSGGVYFREFVHFSTLQWFGFFGGIAIMFTGLYLLASASLAMAAAPLQNHSATSPEQEAELPERANPPATPQALKEPVSSTSGGSTCSSIDTEAVDADSLSRITHEKAEVDEQYPLPLTIMAV
jgi:drug/metabolite transporter (DMT)-like permease